MTYGTILSEQLDAGAQEVKMFLLTLSGRSTDLVLVPAPS